jgi:4-deoxy-L-threo-5-hexosulose-uronate ketol-isomerase
MKTLYLPDPIRTRTLDTETLRASFLIDNLFAPGRLELVAVDVDRAILGGAIPGREGLSLEAPPELRAQSFCERRELGIINVGGAGRVIADSQTFSVRPRECVYVGRGTKKVVFESDDPATPAAFYLTSFPAHASFPTVHAGQDQARTLKLGSLEDCNKRNLYQYIHPEGIKSCQLVMGYTELEPGSVWNTKPPHSHARRCEIYMYFDVEPEARVMHFMGTPEETRHLVMANREAIASPSWSMHFGAGTKNYRFVWAMGGENQSFDDMDHIPVSQLR